MADGSPASRAATLRPVASPESPASPASATGEAPAPSATGAAPGPPVTVGVEEEFLLADPMTGFPVPAAERVLEELRRGRASDGTEFKHELMASQVETTSGICTQLSELAGQLSTGRRRLAEEARRLGLVVLPTGAPAHTAGPAQLTRGTRYEEIRDIYAGVVSDYEACGCQVHVRVPDRETAVAVVGRLRHWLPTLLALSVNSPFHHGLDTGYGSWRMVMQSRFPGSGVPPHFATAADYDEELNRLVACGTLADARQTFWLVRPSECFPTVEFRVADAAATVDEAVLQAALSRALVTTAVEELERGIEAPPVRDQLAAAAVWNAARHGLDGDAVDLRRERTVPATRLLYELIRQVTPALEESGDLERVQRLLGRLTEAGTGAERQRAAAARGHRALLGRLAEEAVRPVDEALSPDRTPTVSVSRREP
ncbi:carboxylate-amine ligase [Streptomyces marispadix]|uniref:Putative glutamate--cysteine ligase 2 n=1 Tax=Streptomyces marispadix TaxID=2922868 RepID=A0ABS9T3J2_9ACTN|nr:glutamate--cysteine ligase [Streptomyces marispadix]MCH6163113.1 glutamate--cysteine ligase [Streptomyces marispadix]